MPDGAQAERAGGSCGNDPGAMAPRVLLGLLLAWAGAQPVTVIHSFIAFAPQDKTSGRLALGGFVVSQ